MLVDSPHWHREKDKEPKWLVITSTKPHLVGGEDPYGKKWSVRRSSVVRCQILKLDEIVYNNFMSQIEHCPWYFLPFDGLNYEEAKDMIESMGYGKYL